MQAITQKSPESFYESVFIMSHSKKTVSTYKTAINHFKKFLSSNYSITETELITNIRNEELDVYDIIRELVIYFDKLGIKPKGIRAYLSGVKGYIRYCGIRINSDDFKQMVKVPKIVRTKEIPLTHDMLLRVLHNANAKLQTAILVATSSGLRIGELVQLTLSDIEFDSNPTKLMVRGSTTKTRQSRETFITTEATNALRDYLARYFGWKQNQDNSDLSTKHIFGPVTNKGRASKEPGFNVESAKLSLQQSLRNHVSKIPYLDVDNENGYKAIHFHAFRKYFRTTVGNVCGRDYAEALMGHGFYMDTYYQLSEKKKIQMYLEAEPHLTISDFEAVERNIKMISEKNTLLEEKFNDLLSYLRANKIEIPNL